MHGGVRALVDALVQALEHDVATPPWRRASACSNSCADRVELALDQRVQRGGLDRHADQDRQHGLAGAEAPEAQRVQQHVDGGGAERPERESRRRRLVGVVG